MSSRNKRGGYFGMIALTLLVLLVATFLMVVIGKKLLEHENSQTLRIEQLEKEKGSLNDSIIDKDATIEELIEHLARAEERVTALEDAYDLNSGKLKSLENWKADIEKKIENGELIPSDKSDDKKDENKDDEKKEKTDKEKTDKEKNEKDKEEESVSKSKGFYQKLVNGENVSLLIVGDSIGVPMDDTSWVVLLKNWIENTYKVKCAVNNVSLSGNVSYAGYARAMMLPKADNYDLAVVCYGHNDFDYGFDEGYEILLRGLQHRFPSCAIISILQSSQRDYTYKIKTIQTLCEYYNIPTADTIKAFANSGIAYEELAPDTVHPEGYGRRLYFETIRDVIKPRVEANETYTYAERSPYVCAWQNFDDVTAYQTSDFKRTDDLTFELEGKFSGFIGVYWGKTQGICGYKFYADDELVFENTSAYDFDFEYFSVNKLPSWVKAKKSIKIVFSDKANADLFYGMVYSH